jgi:hypothetical protein
MIREGKILAEKNALFLVLPGIKRVNQNTRKTIYTVKS